MARTKAIRPRKERIEIDLMLILTRLESIAILAVESVVGGLDASGSEAPLECGGRRLEEERDVFGNAEIYLISPGSPTREAVL